MTMRKLLIVTYHFPPSAASGTHRMLGFVRHLPKFGWQCAVVAPPGLPWEPKDTHLVEQVPLQTPVSYVPYSQSRALKVFRWLAPYGIWLPWALVSCVRIWRDFRPDAVLTSGPPHWVHLLGYFLKRCCQLQWVADFRDPWTTPYSAGCQRSWRNRWQAYWERRVVHQADVIVANAPRARQMLAEAFPLVRNKIVAITNGYDPETFENSAPPPGPGGPLRIVHAGELYAGRDPRPLLDALQDFKPFLARYQRPLRVRFLGQLTAKYFDAGFNFEREIAKRDLVGMVELGGQVSYEQAIQEMTMADILLLLDSPGRRLGVPAKLYEYLGAGRPILALAEGDSDVAWALRESGIPHRMASPSKPVEIKEALAELIGKTSQLHLELPRKSQRILFTREGMAGQLAEIMNSLLPFSKRVPKCYGHSAAGQSGRETRETLVHEGI